MHGLHFRAAARHRFAWVLWLALLLPLAQGAAAWHALSHAPADAGAAQNDKALHTAHCDLCLASAALGTGALPGRPPELPAPVVREPAPRSQPVGIAPAAPAHAYLSRAPPFASH